VFIMLKVMEVAMSWNEWKVVFMVGVPMWSVLLFGGWR